MWNRLRRWLHNLPIHDTVERRQAMLVQVILLGLAGVLLFSALLTLVALPFTTGAAAAANLRNSIDNFQGALFIVVPLVLLRRGAFRLAVMILMIELFLLAFNTMYDQGLEKGWLGALEFALPLSLAALALGRRWLLIVYIASIIGVTATALAWYPSTEIARKIPSASIAFALIAGLLALFLDRFGAAFRESLAALRESEARYRLITDNAADLISLIDHAGRLLYASPSHQLVLGYAPAQLIGSHAIDYVHPDDQRRWLTIDNPSQTLTRYCHADGSWRWIESRGTTVVQQGQAYLLVVSRDVTEQKQMEARLAHNYSLLSAVIEGTPDAVSVKDLQGRYLMLNTASADMLGLAANQVIGKDDTTLFGMDSTPSMHEKLRRILDRGDIQPSEQSITANGVTRTYLASTVPYRDQQGAVIGVINISRDITEHKNLEAQLLQSQKMESIGQLAGGIAHDFNNMLSAVIGFIGSARADLPHNSPSDYDLEAAESAAWRAANLTRQLLAFARKQVVDPQVLNLNTVILDMDKLLRRLIGEEIELITLPAPDLVQVKVDPGHIEQVIINLAVNARDAMPNGGKLIIETANTILDADYTDQHVGVAPGAYVMFAISDTGSGMDAEVQQHIFEPFYTTKEIGKGTGLGLSTCYGIVKQHGGHIWVYSEVGHGTTFKIYLPPVEELPDDALRPEMLNGMLQGNETVLLVEDEPLVRELASTILQAQGYTVLAASNGEEALGTIQTASATIDLLITDVVMPGMRGKALAEQVARMYPDIKVLFISGYATDAIAQHGQLAPGTHFLSKPFTRTAFARKVREVLES
jgi:two-component system, cell cycle sensor histidine kinase and response regulator CckA